MGDDAPQIGRARAALVFGDGDDAKGIIVTVVVDARVRGSGERIRFAGPGVFESNTVEHISEVVLPVVDQICRGIGLRRRRFEISMANVGATAAADLGFAVSGFSADVPVLLGMLSAALQIPLPQDVVSTGHVASSDGRIVLAKGISAKLSAAEEEGSIRTFIYPTFQRDQSIRTLSPREFDRTAQAIFRAPGNARRTAVGDVAELIRSVFRDESVVLASLRRGFFDANACTVSRSDPIDRATRYLTGRNEKRFRSTLERWLLAGESEYARELLSARVKFHLRRKTYPSGLGSRLAQQVCSLPPATRRLKIAFPLVSMEDCIRLGQFASDGDHEDVRLLIDATSGKNIGHLAGAKSGKIKSDVEDETSAPAALEAVLEEISAETLAHKIGVPIDTARAVYHMESVTSECFDEFSEIVASYYLHLLRHTRSVAASVEARTVAAGAFGLLEQAFAKWGGSDAALAEARACTRGGLRFVLDAMTEYFKADQQAKHVKWVLGQAVDPMDWKARVAFTAALVRRLAPHLPAELRNLPAARLARHYELIAQAYVRSFDTVRTLLHRL